MKIECTEKELAGLIKAIQSPQVLSDEIEHRLRAVEGYALNCRKDLVNKTSSIQSNVVAE